MLTDLQDNSTLSKQQSAEPTITIHQALQVLESVASYCKDAGYPMRIINDTHDGVPVLVILLPRVIAVKDGRGIHHFIVAPDSLPQDNRS